MFLLNQLNLSPRSRGQKLAELIYVRIAHNSFQISALTCRGQYIVTLFCRGILRVLNFFSFYLIKITSRFSHTFSEIEIQLQFQMLKFAKMRKLQYFDIRQKM